MEKEKDIEDEKFEALLEQRRHNELKGLLVKLANSMSPKDDSAIVGAINGQGDKIGDLVKAIQNMPKPEKPEKPQVNVQVNQELVISSISKMCEDILASNNKVIEALENRLLPESFVLLKGWNGVTESVKVNYKQANLINAPKSKYQA